MRPRVVAWGVVAAVGSTAMLLAGYLIVRGPFLGGPLLDPVPLMVATGVFIAGLIALALGGTRAVNRATGR